MKDMRFIRDYVMRSTFTENACLSIKLFILKELIVHFLSTFSLLPTTMLFYRDRSIFL